MIGLDTGFFLRVFNGKEQACEVWKNILSGDEAAAISTLTLFELSRHGLRGLIDHEKTRAFVRDLPLVCRVVWNSELELMTRSARISHGNGIPTVDAIILTSLMAVNATRIYTTDGDLEKYEAAPDVVVL